MIAQADHASGHADQAVKALLAILDRANDRQEAILIHDVSIDLAEIYLESGMAGEAARLMEDSGLSAADEPDAIRLRARLAFANGDSTTAANLMTALRSRIGEAWRKEDDELLSSFNP